MSMDAGGNASRAVLVTGSGGFLGGHVVAALQADERCASVRGWRRADGDLATPGGAGALAAALEDEHIDVVVHLAGLIGPGPASADPAGAVAANAGATLLVARACADAGARLVLGSTTDAAWAPDRSNIYALTKAWSEQAAQLAAPPGLAVLRLCGPYGPGIGPGAGRNALVNMAAQAIAGEPLRAWRGVARRWCHVSDIAAAIALVSLVGLADGAPSTIDVGCNDLHELPETAREVCDVAGADRSLVVEVAPPAGVGHGDQPLDLAPLAALGWAPQVAWHDGLVGLVDWVRTL